MLKTYLISALVGLGIAGAIFAFQAGQIAQTAALDAKKVESPSPTPNKPLVEALILKSATNQDESSGENLTELLAKEIGKVILESNPGGPTILDNKTGLIVPDPELIAEELLAKAAEEFSSENLKIEVSDDSIKIIDDGSNKALKDYFLSFKEILEKNATSFSKNLTITPEENFTAFIQQLINMYQQSQRGLYEINVPRLLAPIHKKEISLLNAAEFALTKVQDYQNDPAQALLAIEYYEALDKEFANLKKEIHDLLIERNIQL
jgi:hypothetical protein